MRFKRLLVTATAAPLLMIGMAACTTYSVICGTNSCDVSVKTSGSYTAEVWDYDVTISDLENGSVTVSYGGQSTALKQGERGEVGPLTVEVNKATDGEAKLTITR